MAQVFNVAEERVKQLEHGTSDAQALLKFCNVFHMAGGNAWDLAHLWAAQPELSNILVDRVLSGEILYIGSSGGSFMAQAVGRQITRENASHIAGLNRKDVREFVAAMEHLGMDAGDISGWAMKAPDGLGDLARYLER